MVYEARRAARVYVRARKVIEEHRMRTVFPRSFVSFWLAAAAISAVPLAASAQSFDEFDDAFDDRQRGETPATTTTTTTTDTATTTDTTGDATTTATTTSSTTSSTT